VLMHVKGRGLAFNGVLALGSWDKPKNSFAAPARFKVVYSHDCSSGGNMEFGIAGFDGAVEQQNIASALSTVQRIVEPHSSLARVVKCERSTSW